jgi:serine/threonine protein kinase
MTPKDESQTSESMRQEIQTRHPGIGDEIRGAIQTLRKLQQITGTISPDRSKDGDSENEGPLADADTFAPLSSADDNASRDAPSNVPILAASESFGRYQITRMLGRGAMGAVYLAYDSQLERYVALKTPFLGNSGIVIKRFYREARATAKLRSPYICPIYDVGQISGIHYISMAFIDGQSLKQLIDGGQLKEAKDIAEIIRKVARGLQKAHEHKIIHRDLKPENIIVDADREPIVMDFGLARQVDDDIQITVPGRILGTPAFMSPEQVEGDPTKIGPATDIYSLGVALYQMLTGRIPFQGALTAVLRQIVSDAPKRPSAISAAVAKDSPLERICLKMMAKSPADRFVSMAEVAESLEEAFPPEGATVVRNSIFRRTRDWFAKAFAFRPRVAELTTASGGGSSANSCTDFSLGPLAGEKVIQESSQTVDLSRETPGAPERELGSSETCDLKQKPPAVQQDPKEVAQTVDLPPHAE